MTKGIPLCHKGRERGQGSLLIGLSTHGYANTHSGEISYLILADPLPHPVSPPSQPSELSGADPRSSEAVADVQRGSRVGCLFFPYRVFSLSRGFERPDGLGEPEESLYRFLCRFRRLQFALCSTFSALGLGALVGPWAMIKPRSLPESLKMAGGKR